jgi:hypothetical protein
MAENDPIAAAADAETKIAPRKSTKERIDEVETEVSDAVKAAYGVKAVEDRVAALEAAGPGDGSALAALRAEFDEFKAKVSSDLGL